jgi:hypothetical protein
MTGPSDERSVLTTPGMYRAAVSTTVSATVALYADEE